MKKHFVLNNMSSFVLISAMKFLLRARSRARGVGCLLLMGVMLLAVACGSGPSTDTGSAGVGAAAAIDTGTVDTVSVDTVSVDTATADDETVEPILAPPATPTTVPTTNDSTEQSTAQTNPDANASSEQAAEPTADLATDAGTGCAAEPDLDFAGYPQFGTLQALMGCAVAEPSYEPVAINEFGEGPEFDRFMLWTSTDQQIYVLRPDGSWEMHLDEWNESLPELACSPVGYAFDSPPMPRRGFGKLWCEIGGLAETMGSIAKEERLCQHAVLQQFEGGQLLACFEDATYHYFRIMNDQSWESVFIQ